MHNYIMFASPIGQDSAKEIDLLDVVVHRIVSDIRRKGMELLTLVVRDILDTFSLKVYEEVIKSFCREPVLVEIYLEGRVNLATLDLFSTPLVDELRMSPATLLSLDKMDSSWIPENPVSSCLWSLGEMLALKSAEDASEVYRDSALGEVRLTLDENFLSKIDGDDVYALCFINKEWTMTSMSDAIAA